MNGTYEISEAFVSTNGTFSDIINCQNFTAQEYDTLKNSKYWIGGVIVCVVSFSGVIMNSTAIFALLSSLSNRNNFNQMIILLFFVDSLYLIFSVITTLLIRLGLTHRFLIIIFPKFVYPFWSISLTLSIFLTVGISHERFIAIKYPILHWQRMKSAKYRRITFMKYVVCDFLGAVIFNVPKFFEIDLEWRNSTLDETKDLNQRYLE